MNSKNTCVFKKKVFPITLFNKKLLLMESSTLDFISYIEFTIENNMNKESGFSFFQNAHVLHCSLKNNVDSIPWYRPIKKKLTTFLISEKNILKVLSQTQLQSYVHIVLKIEGLGGEEEKGKVQGDYLGSEQGYALLMDRFNWTVDQIHTLPISKYFTFVNEAFNIITLENGGKYKHASEGDSMKYKKMKAFNEIQELKRKGKWD